MATYGGIFRYTWQVLFVCSCLALLFFGFGNITKTQYMELMRRTDITSLTSEPVVNEELCSSTERQHYIQGICQMNALSTPYFKNRQFMHNILIDDTHKLLYCMNGKIGTISFRVFLGQLATNNINFNSTMVKENYREVCGLRSFEKLSVDEQDVILKTYKKLLVVRHPLDRLRSAYDAKLSKPGALNSKALTEEKVNIINKYLKPMKRSFDPAEHHLTFENFIEMVATKYTDGFVDQHWMQIYDHCMPCEINYDFILRLETLPYDILPLYKYLETFEGPLPAHITNANLNYQGPLTGNKLSSMKGRYENISTGVMQNLVNVYQKDMTLFGYDWDSKLGGSCAEQMPSGRTCC